MIKMEKIDDNNKIIYVVDNIENWNELTEWLYGIEDEEISLFLSGNLYHFRTREERRYFVLGFQKAWDIIDDDYLKKSHNSI